MHFSRTMLALLLAIVLIPGALVSVAAQDTAEETPVPPWSAGTFPGGTPVAGLGGPAPDYVAQPGEGTLPNDPQVQLVLVTDQVFEPVNIAAPNDGTGRIFVVERAGRIRVIDGDGNLLEEPFLDIQNNVQSQFLEQGLLGLAFHPDYANNGLFYVNYTDLLRAGDLLTVQYRVSADNPNVADPASALLVWWRTNPYANHLGGDIVFGPDGYLYIGHGDGGMEGDPFDAGQRLDTHLGKLLRIDVTPAVERANAMAAAGADGGVNATYPATSGAYAIPADNPFSEGDQLLDLFAGTTEEDFAQYHPIARPEIYDWGLRNPWQFSFDRATGDLWIGDVGQNFWEEVNFAPAGYGGGVNWGWRFLQGSHCYPNSLETCPLVGTLPVAEYEHDAENGCTVVGGHVYRGDEFTSLQGTYFHGDYCSGKVYGIAPAGDGTWAYQQLLDTGLLMTGTGEDEAGNIYFASCECGYGQMAPNRAGAVWKLVAADQVPEGATTAPPDREAAAEAEGQAPATPAVGEGFGTPEAIIEEATPAP